MTRTVMDEELSERFYRGNEELFQSGRWHREIEELGLDWQGKKVLDLAAGTGHWEEVFLSFGAGRVFWQDLSGYFYEKARQRFRGDSRVEFFLGDMTAVLLDDESVDFVMCRDSLYHSSDEAKTLTEVYRVLKRDGYFYLTTRTWRRILHEPLGWKSLFKLVAPYLYHVTGKKLLPTVFHPEGAVLSRLRQTGFRIDRVSRSGDSILTVLAYK